MRLSEMKTADQVHQENMQDPEYRVLWERTALARAVAIALVRYRVDHQLSQRGLAKILGWQQPQVARLELGEHTPSIETLLHLAQSLGMHFGVAIGGLHVEQRPGDVVEKTAGGQVTVTVGADERELEPA